MGPGFKEDATYRLAYARSIRQGRFIGAIH